MSFYSFHYTCFGKYSSDFQYLSLFLCFGTNGNFHILKNLLCALIIMSVSIYLASVLNVFAAILFLFFAGDKQQDFDTFNSQDLRYVFLIVVNSPATLYLDIM